MFFFPSLTSGAAGVCSDDSYAEQLRGELLSMAAPSSCFNCVRELSPIAGFGSMVSSWVKPLMYAMENNKTFLSPTLGAYKDKDDVALSASRSFRCEDSTTTTCFFEPLSRCEVVQQHQEQHGRGHKKDVVMKSVAPGTHKLFDGFVPFFLFCDGHFNFKHCYIL
jgi:hypothetical protein